MEKYREELNSIHAPEDLILRTLSRVKEEEARLEAENKAEQTSENYAEQQNENISDNINKPVLEENQTIYNSPNNQVNYQNNPQLYSNSNVPMNSGGSNNYNSYIYGEDNNENVGYDYTTKKKGFFSKYRRVIGVIATVATVALILIIAVNSGLLSGRNMSATSDTAEYSATEASVMEEAGAGESSASASADADDYSYDYEETTEAFESYSDEAADSNADSFEEAEDEDSDEHAADDSREKKDNNYKQTLNPDMNNLSIGDYSAYLGVDLVKMLDGITIKNQFIYAAVDENSELTSDYGTFDLEALGGAKTDSKTVITFHVSKTKEVAPLELTKKTPSYLEGQKVYMDEESEPDKCSASFDIDGIHFMLESENLSKDDFESMLIELLN